MYDAATRSAVLARLRAGESLRGLERSTGISRVTLREWRERNGAVANKHQCGCHLCTDRALPREPYLYLLGQYLGDGCIDALRRTWVLRIAACDAYPNIRDEIVTAISCLVPNPVHYVRKEGCTSVGCITRQWLHLLPQHGRGRKHERPIVLAPWQQDLVQTDPRPLIRGLIHSDGCRVTNWTERRVGGTVKRYTYPRYFFSNVSDDIRGIFTDALDLLDIPWRQNRWNSISVARREGVAALDEFVGPKTWRGGGGGGGGAPPPGL
jgi:hypothetical protein